MLKVSNAPHIRTAQRPSYQSFGVLLCMIPLTAFACLHHGIRPLLLVSIGMLSAAVTEFVCGLFRHGRPSMSDATCLVTGALIGGMMSPLCALWVPAIGSAFAIGVAKMPFGGTGRNIFNPAAAGVAFCAVCFPTRLYEYPAGTATSYNWVALLSGDFPGPIGSTGVLVLCACAIYLFARHSSSPFILLPYLAVCAIAAALFPRTAIGPGASVLLELCTGLLLFSGVFLLSDPVTAPRFWLARIVYGVLAGILTMLLRHFGQFVYGEFFAVLLINPFSPLLDRYCWQLVRPLQPKGKEVGDA